MLVSTGSYRRYFYRSLGQIHGDLLTAIEHYVKPGAVVYDVGANMGVFAFAAALSAGAAGKIYAFEAEVASAALMARSLRWKLPDREAPVVICPFALADKAGTVSFEVSHYRSAASAIQGFGRFQNGGLLHEVPVFSMDELIPTFTAPTVIKIDVEGAENLVLSGARKTLEKFRPLLLVECTGGEVGKESAEFLRLVDYEWKPWLEEGAFSQENLPAGDIVARPL